MELAFYRCKHCGSLVEVVRDGGEALCCCGAQMERLVPGTTDGAAEKHVPVYETSAQTVTVQVGEAEHPMIEAHSIEWIALETRRGCQRRHLAPGEAPRAIFHLAEDDAPTAVYAYCNLHGLWKA